MRLRVESGSSSVEIWKPLPLLISRPESRWTSADGSPAACITSRTPFSSAFLTSSVLMRVPDSKSMPKFRPLPPIASAPMARITPEKEKNHFDAPMKSKPDHGARRWWLAPPKAAGWVMSRDRPARPSTAWVRTTAVKKATRVPTPSVNANPLIPAVARMKRMNATMNVTTFASMIADRPFR